MCGISGVFRFGGNAVADLGELDRMHSAQLHRGPDSEGAFTVHVDGDMRRYERIPLPAEVEGDACRGMLAVRRLRVSDLRPEADQPLFALDRMIAIVFNGAIFNASEIAAELRAAGRSLRTSSDTEIVLEAYGLWGTDCFARLNGMWAVLIVDVRRGRLVGARDRLGIKPLYYAIDGERVFFASEPQAIAQAMSTGAEIEPARLFEFLSGYPPRSNTLTFFRGVHPVPAGAWFEAALHARLAAGLDFTTFWSLADHYCDGSDAPLSFVDAAKRYADLLESSVRGQSVADVKVGSLLSGGLDTSTIVSLWAKAAGARKSQAPLTFSIAWDDREMSEHPYQEAVLQWTGASGHTLTPTPAEVWNAVDEVVAAQGEPLLGQELIAQYLVYRMAREKGAVVVMDGSGSDEILAGLPPYEAEMVLERLEAGHWIDMVRELRCIARNYGRPFLTVVRQYLVGPLKRKLRERKGLPRYAWLNEEACDRDDPAWESARTCDVSHDSSRLNRLLYRETRHTNLPVVLMHSDRNAMAHGVEARFPFLDHRLVEFCFSMPARYKVGFGRRKRMLLELAKACLPPMVTFRKDKKYFVLLTNWMPLREHAEEIRRAARHPVFDRLPWIDVAQLRGFVEDYLAGAHDNAYAVWRIYTAARWFDTFRLWQR